MEQGSPHRGRDDREDGLLHKGRQQPGAGERQGHGVSAPPVPPRPAHLPSARPPLDEWLRGSRPEAEPGIWRYGHEPREPEDPDRVGTRQLLGGALLALLVAWLVWSLIMNGYIPVLDWIYGVFPTSWAWGGDSHSQVGSLLFNYLIVYGIPLALILYVAARAGRWPEVWRRFPRAWIRSLRGDGASGQPSQGAPAKGRQAQGAQEHRDAWPELRGAGEHAAAEKLDAEAAAGRMSDVDYARIRRAWESVGQRPERRPVFTDEVLRKGAAACAHLSGARDLPHRSARHDLLTGQVRLGEAADTGRNPHTYRGTGVALEPGVLSTSLLVVGPSGAGKTSRVVRPVVESFCLQALTGRAAVVAVGAEGGGLGPDGAYDMVIKPGHPESAYDLDLYGGATDPDEAAALLAEALVGADPQADVRRAATVLAQIIGPFRVAHGRFPRVPELRELADGVPAAVAALREACEAAGSRHAGAALRELDARERQSGRPGDPGPLLADRIALLDRPAFAGFFGTASGTASGSAADPASGAAPGSASGATSGSVPGAADGATGEVAVRSDGEGGRVPTGRQGPAPFSMRALDRPVRIRVDLPERTHAEASRLLARLLLAQFSAAALAREDRSLFACLALDDAAQTLTESSVAQIRRLRSVNAGVVLGLRTLGDVPEGLRATVLGAVGCRLALAGITTWDGEVFAQSWGRDWVETEDVTHAPAFHGGLVVRWVRGIRTLFTGVRATTESVTVRREQRERWSASELANELRPEHAVLSLTTARGERTPPILTRLGD
ncbi:ATP-binding protein [Streptomyces sp. ODS28]|uniref:ATP-binding protein n=1 Tax=Streptomyces sp. ODS28 TaxID=3136688 RepID=UPI0031F0ACB4